MTMMGRKTAKYIGKNKEKTLFGYPPTTTIYEIES